ncbi:hypothetical protein PoB_001379100 [Plakobranchus ocellatus]|uniref:Uncharacterized protein n=1 Tax=Plakobranchus ocellatus TaxID=259542 RepID=A0AAV3YV26_9GAST|nr:hypothetical protein PoB_001379100 [Plakobranchus ocellatus]
MTRTESLETPPHQNDVKTQAWPRRCVIETTSNDKGLARNLGNHQEQQQPMMLGTRRVCPSIFRTILGNVYNARRGKNRRNLERRGFYAPFEQRANTCTMCIRLVRWRRSGGQNSSLNLQTSSHARCRLRYPLSVQEIESQVIAGT